MSDTPAGWYPDPTPATPAPTLRYWDGQAWTGHVHPPAAAYARPAGPTTPDGVRLASWGQRVVAQLIDIVPVVALGALMMGLAAVTAPGDRRAEIVDYLVGPSGATPDLWLLWGVQLPADIAVLSYFALMLRWKGATLGKLAMGIQVRLWESAGRLPWSSILVRVAILNGLLLSLGYLDFTGLAWLGTVLMGPAVIFGLMDGLWPLWDSRRQALHDKPARTCVVRTR